MLNRDSFYRVSVEHNNYVPVPGYKQGLPAPSVLILVSILS